MPVTAIKFFGLFLYILDETIDSNFLGFSYFKNKILFLKFSFILEVTTILDPLFIASSIYFLPSTLSL